MRRRSIAGAMIAAPLSLTGPAAHARPRSGTLDDAALRSAARVALPGASTTAIGRHHGAVVVAERRCGDDCRMPTRAVIRYAVHPGPACGRIGGVEASIDWPDGPAGDYCVPRVLAGFRR